MNLVSELGQVLLLAALAAWAAKRVFGSDRAGRAAAVLSVILGLGPLVLGPEWTPSFYTRALLGDPAALGWIYLLHLLLRSTGGPQLLGRGDARALAVSAVAGACLVYPASFGVPGAPDLYRMGFGGFILPTLCLAVAAFFGWRGWKIAAAGTACGLFLCGLELHESANLFDCLFDLPSVFISIVIVVQWAAGTHRRLRGGPDGASLGSPSTPP